MSSLPAGRPSRRSSADTKARIVEAAQLAFASRGYVQSVLTEIAESADVTAPLIIRYFGSKEALFEEALSQSLDGLPMYASDPAEFGKIAIGMMTGGHVSTARASGMIALSIGDPRARDIAVRLIRARVLGPLAGWMAGAQGDLRAELTLMLGIGYTTMRMIIPVADPDAGEPDFLSDWMVNAVQSLVDCDTAIPSRDAGHIARQPA